MSAPHDLYSAHARLCTMLDYPIGTMHASERETLITVRAQLASLIERCERPEDDRAAIESLCVADKGRAA